MLTQKRFSKLTIIAIALLASSIPCFAQTDSGESASDSTSFVTVAINERPKVDQRFGITHATAPSISNTETNDRPSAFSTAKFMAGVKQSIADTSQSFAQTSTFELRPDSKRSLRTDESAEPVKAKSVVFVPSRGQKLPD